MTDRRPPRPTLLASRCPCLSGLPYGECCAPYHRGDAAAPTAERLMRSRFSAFAVGEPAYLSETWHPSTRPASLELDAAQRWYRLDILQTTRGGLLDTEGTVEFRAYFRYDGPAREKQPELPKRGEQHEVSRFVRENRRWYYLDAL